MGMINGGNRDDWRWIFQEKNYVHFKFSLMLAGYNNKSKRNNLKLCLLVIKISANTNNLNIDFLNLKIEWKGTYSIDIIIVGSTIRVLLFLLDLLQVD